MSEPRRFGDDDVVLISREMWQAAREAVAGIAIEVIAACDGFAGHCPDVPGYVAAAETEEEVRRVLRDALAAHLLTLPAHDPETGLNPRSCWLTDLQMLADLRKGLPAGKPASEVYAHLRAIAEQAGQHNDRVAPDHP